MQAIWVPTILCLARGIYLMQNLFLFSSFAYGYKKMREEPCMHRLVIQTRMRSETYIGLYARMLLKIFNRNEDLNS